MLLNLRVGPNFNRAKIGNGVVLWNMMVSRDKGRAGRVWCG